MKVELGGGRNSLDGYVNVDIIPEADHVINLEYQRLPFDSQSVDEIYSNHTLEHIDNLIHVMNECWRVMKYGAKLYIIVPHKDCELAWQDPTHKRYFVPGSMKYFCGEYLKKYKLGYGIVCCFKLIKVIHRVPDDRPDYFKELTFVLEKNKKHCQEVKYPKDILRKCHKPNRPAEFEKIAKELQTIFKKKNADYGDDYFTGNYLAAERWMSIKRKMSRLETFYQQGKLEVEDETIDDTWKDLAIYCIMELMKRKQNEF